MLLLPLPRDSLELFPHIRRTACRKLDMIQGLVTPWMPCNREIVRNSTHTRSSPGRAVLVRPHHLATLVLRRALTSCLAAVACPRAGFGWPACTTALIDQDLPAAIHLLLCVELLLAFFASIT